MNGADVRSRWSITYKLVYTVVLLVLVLPISTIIIELMSSRFGFPLKLMIITTRKMVFGDEWLSSPKPFISSLRLLRDEHDFVTLSLSLKVIVMNFFVIELFCRTKEKNLFVTHMFRHPIFSSPIVLFVDKIFRHSIFLFSFLFFLLSCGVMILFYHLMFSSPNVLFVDKIFRQ